MVMWKKALVVCMAVLVVALPLITQVSMAQAVPAQKQEAQVVLPQGKELSDKELQKADGEGPVLALIGAIIAGVGTYEAESYYHQKPNPWEISKNTVLGAAAGLGIPSEYDGMLVSGCASAIRWTARAAAAGALRAASRATKIAYGFNHYIGGPIRRFFTGGK